MKIQETPIKDLLVVELDVHGDERGFFVERFHEEKFESLGLPTSFPQDNHSRSAPNVLRGVHYQNSPSQGKLVGVIRGKIWDLALDLRPESATFGKHFGVELDDISGRLLWIPPGFAHGFCVTSDDITDVYYKTTAIYNPDGESGILWNDPELSIDWPIKNPIISSRDTNQQSFKDYKSHPPKWD